MAKITVDAYDQRHPEHEKLMNLECDTGLDIELLPGFEVQVDAHAVSDTNYRHQATHDKS